MKEGGLRRAGRLVTERYLFCPWTAPWMIYDMGRQNAGQRPVRRGINIDDLV